MISAVGFLFNIANSVYYVATLLFLVLLIWEVSQIKYKTYNRIELKIGSVIYVTILVSLIMHIYHMTKGLFN